MPCPVSELQRISSSIFTAEGGKHDLRYSRDTGHLVCSCASFTFSNDCRFADEARKILEDEGKKVAYRRKPPPIFIHEISRFGKRVREVLAR